MKRKILIVTPKFPYPAKGACEQDRARGIERLIEMGHEVYVITKIYNKDWLDKVEEVKKRLNIPIVPIIYKYTGSPLTAWQKIRKILAQIIQPWYLDGAAFEYTDPKIKKAVAAALDNFEPDLVWFDYTYLWPLYRQVKKQGIPIITRSINVEANHFLEEDGRSLPNYLKFLPKLITEHLMCWMSDAVMAITPREYRWYKKRCKCHLDVLPLRALPKFLRFQAQIQEKDRLEVFFFGSTYNVHHNLSALKFLLNNILPKTQASYPGKFHFNIFGGKVPAEMQNYALENVTIHGYLSSEELEDILSKMDIAIIPSLYGAGMQQKIFEPLARGFPTIASTRGIAGYSFVDDRDLKMANTGEQFVAALGKMQDIGVRKEFSKNAKKRSQEVFSQEEIDKVVSNALKEVLMD